GVGDVRVRHLDGHETSELLVEGEIDQPKAALSQQALDAIASNVCRFPAVRDGGLDGVWRCCRERIGRVVQGRVLRVGEASLSRYRAVRRLSRRRIAYQPDAQARV